MSKPLFSIIFASCRPSEIPKHLAHWETQTEDLSRCEFIIAVDELDPESTAAAKRITESYHVEGARSNWHCIKLCIVPAPSRNCIVAWNTAAKMAEGKVFLVTSDDFEIPAGWDTYLANVKCSCDDGNGNKLTTPWWEYSHVVHTDDGHTSFRHGICTFPIITEAWYKERGYVYHPDYAELFGDQELCQSAYKEGAAICLVNLKFTHNHYTVHKREYDQVDERHNSREAWNKDEATYAKRKAAGFPVTSINECTCADLGMMGHTKDRPKA